MDYNEYRKAYFVQPPPQGRFRFVGSFGTTLYYEDYQQAIAFYERALGPPSYLEGESTRGWPVGKGWLTLLRGKSGNPRNVEITLELATVEQAEALQQAFLSAGAEGQTPSDQLMYRPIRACPVIDPFGLEIMIIAHLKEYPDG
jgi:uncharacterized glyoxalase superfamily protein PhnB